MYEALLRFFVWIQMMVLSSRKKKMSNDSDIVCLGIFTCGDEW